MMVDTVRGVLRVRKWPKKRGKPTSASQLWWIDWFKQANYLAKYADGMAQARAIAMTKGTGLYPRDVMLKAMRGRLYTFVDDTGWKWFPVAAIQDISDSLDVLAQTIGSVLVRATDRWRAPTPGSIGDVLTYKGDAAAPEWNPIAAPASSFSGALVYWTSHAVIPNATFTPVVYDAEISDTDGFHDPAVNPSRLTIPAGVTAARLTGCVSWSTHGTGERIVAVYKNGVSVPGGGWVRDPNSDGIVSQSLCTPVLPCVAGDYFELFVYQTRGGTLAFEAGNIRNAFGIQAFA